MMIARHNVLEELGYAQGWTLNANGQLLRSMYHECDLLIAESINAGVFEDSSRQNWPVSCRASSMSPNDWRVRSARVTT